jgi:hypothetical protein
MSVEAGAASLVRISCMIAIEISSGVAVPDNSGRG